MPRRKRSLVGSPIWGIWNSPRNRPRGVAGVVAGFLLVTSIGSVSFAADEAKGDPVVGPRTTDEAFFAALRLDMPALAKVRQCVEREDWAAARQAFGEHLLNRDHPRWYYDAHQRGPATTQPAQVDLERVERFVRNELTSVDVWHNFGPDIDWKHNPTHNAYREFTWQLNRQGYWREMGRAYWNTGDERYAEAFVRQMRDWIRDNPVPVGGADQGTGSTWRTIEAGIRMGQSWPEAFYRFLGSPAFTADDMCMMVKSFAEHARYLVKYPTSANWLMMESCGLYHVGALFPEFAEAKRWRDTALKRLYDELAIQVYPDGAQFELSTGYHQATLKNAEWALRLAQLNGYRVPDDFLDRLERMNDFNLYLARPDWYLPPLNDAYDRIVFDLLQDAYELYPQRKDYLFAATAGREGEPPEHTSYAFPYAGFLVMRSGWNTNARWAMLEVGPFGYGHQHEDKLQLLLYAYGHSFLIDPGSYHYDTSKWRGYVLRGHAHNAMLIDGLEQHRRGIPRDRYVVQEPLAHQWVTNPRFDYASGSYGTLPHERYSPDGKIPAVWHRHVMFVKHPQSAQASATDARTTAPVGDYWAVVDTLAPNDNAEHLYQAMFHVDAADVRVGDDARVDTRNPDGPNLAIVPARGSRLQVEVIKGQEEPYVQGWISEGAYEMRAIPTLYFGQKRAGPCCFVYVFYPVPGGTALPRIEVDASPCPAKAIEVTVRIGDGPADRLTFGSKPALQHQH